MIRKLLVPVAAGWLLPALAAAQTPAPSPSPSEAPVASGLTFAAGVDLVTVDVVVTDKKDVPVAGLTREDFTVLEDGRPQTVDSFEAVQLPGASAAPAELPARAPVSTNEEPPARNARSYVIVYDDIHLSPFQAQRAKAAVAEFLKEGVVDGDQVSLMATGGTAWWSTRMPQGRDDLIAMVKRLDGRLIPDTSPDRVSEYEALRIHMYQDPQVIESVSRRFDTYGAGASSAGRDQTLDPGGNPLVRARASDVYFQSVTRNRLTLLVLRRALESLSVAKGRKSLILVSQGFVYDPNIDEFRQVLQEARRANVAIFFLDTRGLSGLPAEFSAEFGPALDVRDVGFAFVNQMAESEGSESLALDSGGFVVKNSNDLSRGVQRIAQEARTYYLLGYHPANPRQEGRFRKIDVKVNRKGTSVRARKGYYEPLPNGEQPAGEVEKGTDPEIQRALDSPYTMGALPMRMTSYVFDESLLGRATVLMAADVDVRKMAFREEQGRSVDSLELLLVVAHRETGEYYRYDQKIDMRLSPSTRERLDQSWMPIRREFELAPGGYQAKLVVRDINARRVATVVHEFEVPDLKGLRLSSPVLTDTVQTGAVEARNPGVHTVPLARRSFAPGSTLFVQFEVYGAEREQAAPGMPRVSAGIELRDDQGKLLNRIAPSLIRPTSLGKLTRIVGLPLAGLAAGSYQAVLTVTDTLTGKSLERKEPFTVDPAEPVVVPPPGLGGAPADAAASPAATAAPPPVRPSPAPSPEASPTP